MIKLGIVMDPIATINIKKDTSFAMLLEAQRRGYELHYMEMNDLYLINGEARARTRTLSVEQNYDKWYDFTGEQDLPLADLDVILMRKDPPFDTEFIYATYILERAEEKGTLIVNKPQSLRDCNEKLFTAWFSELTPETLVTRNKAQLKAFWEKHGDIIMKPLDGMGGASIFRVKAGDPNLGVIAETLTELGSRYCMAQNYLPAIKDGDKRVLVVDGVPVPYGVLLSGGLDSSVISAITKKFAARRVEDQERSEAWWPQLHSFAVGLEGSPDLKAAQEVANHLGTVHHEIHFTVQEGLDAIRDVIYHIETYDVTTIRASTPMYLMSRKIKAMGIKMVLSGEGSDEVFGGYLYFHKAPNAKELHEETVRKLQALHMFDCARANKAMSAWGVEARVPFLDKKFLDVAMRINPQDKMCGNGKMEKHILRECFESYLPASV
ncbi:MAG: glutathione synthase, partial [Klebsiella pneumoniae]|nr:glutathione synthase [Klebsiella pneumoniae]